MEITDKELQEWKRDYWDSDVDSQVVLRLIAEVRRLRKENARLKARSMSKDNIARLQWRMSEGVQT